MDESLPHISKRLDVWMGGFQGMFQSFECVGKVCGRVIN